MSYKFLEGQSKLPHIKTTIFTVMSGLAAKHQAINLSQGFPDFDSDPVLIELVNKAMKSGFNQYAPMPGVFSLREAIAQKFDSLYQATYDPESEITISSGATQAIFSIIAAFVKKDDEVLVFKPAYDCYEPAIELQGAKPVYVQLKGPDYAIDWSIVKTMISKKTKMIIINSPHNPSGTILSKKGMMALEVLVKDTDIIILSDEVYEHIVFDQATHQSACLFKGLKERTFITASFGKTFHNTGWKTGYCVGPKALMKEFRKVHQFNVFCVNHPMQIAYATYLKKSENYLSLNSFYQDKRDFFLEAIKGSRFEFKPAVGTYFQLLNFNKISQESDLNFALHLVKTHGLASIPISGFNHKNLDEKYLRFCFAKKKETLKKAAEILCAI